MDITFGRIIKTLFGLGAVAASIWLLVALHEIVILLLIAALIAYILDPIASYLEFRGLSRTQAAVFIFAGLVVLFAALSWLLAPALAHEITALQEGFHGGKASSLIQQLEQFISSNVPILADQSLHLQDQLSTFLQQLADSFFSILLDVVSLISTIVIIPFAAFFLLKDGRSLKKALVSAIPNRYFEMALNLMYKVDLQLGDYLRGQFLDAFLVGLLALIAMWILNVPYFVMIGVFAGLANMIPYVGPMAGAVAAVSVVALNDGSVQEILWVIAAFSIVQLIDNILIQPLVLARSVNLHPLTIILAILIGGQFFGIIGMLLAVPATGIVKVVSKEVYQGVQRFKIY